MHAGWRAGALPRRLRPFLEHVRHARALPRLPPPVEVHDVPQVPVLVPPRRVVRRGQDGQAVGRGARCPSVTCFLPPRSPRRDGPDSDSAAWPGIPSPRALHLHGEKVRMSDLLLQARSPTPAGNGSRHSIDRGVVPASAPHPDPLPVRVQGTGRGRSRAARNRLKRVTPSPTATGAARPIPTQHLTLPGASRYPAPRHAPARATRCRPPWRGRRPSCAGRARPR